MLSTQASGQVKELLTENGLHDSVWGHRILKACRIGEFAYKDIRAADRWTTCACGRASPNIPRDRKSGRPEDYPLRHLGHKFSAYVMAHEITLATKTLIQIEERAIEVAKEFKRGVEQC